MRVLITGSRNWTDVALISYALRGVLLLAEAHEITIVHGGAGGADAQADAEARRLGMAVEAPWLPDYTAHHHRIAPLRRNDAMLDSKPDLVLAFMLGMPEAGGTLYTINGARTRKIPTIVHHLAGGDHDTGSLGLSAFRSPLPVPAPRRETRRVRLV